MVDYRVGDVVNGHVWTGTAWKPAPPPPEPRVVKVEIPTWGGTLRYLTLPSAIFLWVLVVLVLIGPLIDDLGSDLQREANGDFAEGFANIVRGLGYGSKYPVVLWVLIPLAVCVTALAVVLRRKPPSHN